MSKVLVTGGCGFIGSNLVDMLVERGDEVVVIDNLITGSKDNCNEKAKYIFEDYRAVLNSVLKLRESNSLLSGVEVIYHLAAMPRIQPSFESPVYTFENNSSGTVTVCEFAKKSGARVVYAGSSSYYGGVYLNPYSFSKWVGEEICKLYSEVYGVSTAIARFFNVYGPRHLSEGAYSTVVAIFERQYSSGSPLTITGDGEQRRDFTHVYDICSGLIAMGKSVHKSEVYNLGTGKNYSINELAQMFSDLAEGGCQLKYIDARPGEARITLADTAKIRDETGWFAAHGLLQYVRQLDTKK